MKLRILLPSTFFSIHLLVVLVIGAQAYQAGEVSHGGIAWMLMFVPDLPVAIVFGDPGMRGMQWLWEAVLGDQWFIEEVLAPGSFFAIFGGLQWALVGWIGALILQRLTRRKTPPAVHPIVQSGGSSDARKAA